MIQLSVDILLLIRTFLLISLMRGIFKCGDIQNTSLIPDEELNILVY